MQSIYYWNAKEKGSMRSYCCWWHFGNDTHHWAMKGKVLAWPLIVQRYPPTFFLSEVFRRKSQVTSQEPWVMYVGLYSYYTHTYTSYLLCWLWWDLWCFSFLYVTPSPPPPPLQPSNNNSSSSLHFIVVRHACMKDKWKMMFSWRACWVGCVILIIILLLVLYALYIVIVKQIMMS